LSLFELNQLMYSLNDTANIFLKMGCIAAVFCVTCVSVCLSVKKIAKKERKYISSFFCFLLSAMSP